MKILLFASAYNGMCQRIHRELVDEHHSVSIELSPNSQDMINAAETFLPELILCPFLKHPVPSEVWNQFTCLIIHPGIEGDRGPSSLDWAIQSKTTSWGVTLLQANAEMDAGDIWHTEIFNVRNASKASIYRREVTSCAAKMIKQLTQHSLFDSAFTPRKLDYQNPDVKGQYLPLMRQENRKINWLIDTTATIVRKINAADSFPGTLDSIQGVEVYLFGAKAEYSLHGAPPGEVIGYRDGAICRATIDGSVWIRQLKMAPSDGRQYFKLPSLQVITQQFPHPERFSQLHALPSTIQRDVHVTIQKQIAYVTFDFYNGAMNTEQCNDLLAHLRELRTHEDVRVIALMGGEDFWSNGIHLNCIQAAIDPARESWRNINAMNDVVHELITMTNKITVACLRNNAGAGGAILPLACDIVLARDGIVLNPHYVTMGLYGSEYWTYLLPKRVGTAKALELTENGLPLLAKEALRCRLVDKVLCEDWSLYHQLIQRECESLAENGIFHQFIIEKQKRRLQDEGVKPLELYRHTELTKMKAIFDNANSDYHKLRYNFVYKISCGKTPLRLTQQPAIEAVEHRRA